MKNLKDFVLAGLLLSVGLVLHAIVPPTGTPVKPDFLLAMLFVCLLMFDDMTLGIVVGVAAGILAGMTTGLPGGFFPNLVDKIATTVFLLFSLRVVKPRINLYIISIATPILGTIFSGTVFLLSAIAMGVLPKEAFGLAFVTAVLPATIGNTILVSLLFTALKQTGKFIVNKKANV
jgi:hypothetical protein